MVFIGLIGVFLAMGWNVSESLFAALKTGTEEPFSDEGPGWGVISLAMILGVVVRLWRYALVPFVAVSREALIVRNPLVKRRIPWSEIASCVPSYYGLQIGTHNGRTVTAVAIPKGNLSLWLNRLTRPDRICQLILTEAARGRNTP
jgi:hypothetical protein